MVKETQDMSHMGSRKEVLKQNHSVCVYGMVIRSKYYGSPQIKYFWNKFQIYIMPTCKTVSSYRTVSKDY